VVDDDRLRRRPAPGEWAIIEVVAHLADTEDRAVARVRRMLAEDSPFLEPFDQEALAEERGYLDLNLQGELARLEELRRQHVAELEASPLALVRQRFPGEVAGRFSAATRIGGRAQRWSCRSRFWVAGEAALQLLGSAAGHDRVVTEQR
jgi:DinB family protein